MGLAMHTIPDRPDPKAVHSVWKAMILANKFGYSLTLAAVLKLCQCASTIGFVQTSEYADH